MVIARFSLSAFLASQAGLLGLTIALWGAVLGNVHDSQGVPASQDPFAWIFCLLSLFFVWLAFVQARQFLFHGRRAVWIDDGVLCYFTQLGIRPLGSAPLSVITGFSAGQFSDRPWVSMNVIQIESEVQKSNGQFMTWPLSERREVVLARLNEALANSRR
jgi:hypothetical protein